MTSKVMCEACGWAGVDSDICEVADPGGNDIWQVCPYCRTPENLILICEHNGCRKTVSSATPVAGGYAQTCFQHSPKEVN